MEEVSLSWRNLNVTTQGGIFSKKSRHILKNANGYVNKGELVAVMGPAGAGKSTLFNALMFQNTRGLKIEGERYANGLLMGPTEMASIGGYVQQFDLFIGTLTVKEQLWFLSTLRLGKQYSEAERKEKIAALMTQLGLTKCANTLIGTRGSVKGISGGEMRRLSFASEILADPPLLLCDEPTSGLDSWMTENVVDLMRDFTRNGRTVLCIIHQPSSEVYYKFDRLLLMSEGRTAFMGDIKEGESFFESIGYPCPTTFNPADHYIYKLSMVPRHEEEYEQRVKYVCDEFEKSSYAKKMLAEVDSHITDRVVLFKNENFDAKLLLNPYQASWFQQFTALLWRSWHAIAKNPLVAQIRMVEVIFLGLLVGTIFFQMDSNQADVQGIAGALFWTTMNMTFSNYASMMDIFCSEIPTFMREHNNGLYRTDVYFLAKQIADIPLYVVTPIIFMSIFYFMVGLTSGFDRFMIAVVITILIVQAAVGLGVLISCASPSFAVALAVGPTLTVPLMNVGGFYQKVESIPGWLVWIKYISSFFYGFEALSVNQWKDVEGISCGLASDDACLNDGAEVLEFYDLDEDNLLFDMAMLLALAMGFRLMGYIILYVKAKRTNK